jgi:hypothetical protein
MCKASADANSCYDCCATAHPGVSVGDDAFGTCACQTPGTCAAQCANDYCKGQQPSAACSTCLDNATQCNTQADAACNANPDCMAFDTCVTSSSCDSKP